jgi:hypothetical protein
VSGPPPNETRRRRNAPARGDWQPTAGIGWQHSKTAPKAPDGLKPASLAAWRTWMGSWFASHWTPDDIPGLRIVIATYDQVERGEFQRGPELRMLMDTYGITPKGQQDRRWQAPKPEETPADAAPAAGGRYGHLKAV